MTVWSLWVGVGCLSKFSLEVVLIYHLLFFFWSLPSWMPYNKMMANLDVLQSRLAPGFVPSQENIPRDGATQRRGAGAGGHLFCRGRRNGVRQWNNKDNSGRGFCLASNWLIKRWAKHKYLKPQVINRFIDSARLKEELHSLHLQTKQGILSRDPTAHY